MPTDDPLRPTSPRPQLRAAARRPVPENPRFSQPVRQITFMLTVLILVGIGMWMAYGRILPIFLANIWLNGVILAVFAFGILTCFWQVAQLIRSVIWIEDFAARRNAKDDGFNRPTAPRLLTPLASLLGSQRARNATLSTSGAQSILDSVATRIDELRDITRYIVNLLIFLGLLGTFYGLTTTVPAVVDTIRALAPQGNESGLEMFDRLMQGLESQLGGMGTAFSSSLLGLAGSLVVGLLELFATHGQNRFYRELEEWMSGFTRVSMGDAGAGGFDADTMALFLDGLDERLERQMDGVSDYMERSEEHIAAMAVAVQEIGKQAQAAQDVETRHSNDIATALAKLNTTQDALLAKLSDEAPKADADHQIRERVLSEQLGQIQRKLADISYEMTEARGDLVSDLRNDLLVLTRAVRALRFGDRFPDKALDEAQDHLPPIMRHKEQE